MSITNSKQVKSWLVLNIRRKYKAILVKLFWIIGLIPDSSSESKFLNYIFTLLFLIIYKWRILVRFRRLFRIECSARSFRFVVSIFCIRIENRNHLDKFVFWVHPRLDLSFTFNIKFVFPLYQISSLLSIEILFRWIQRSWRIRLASLVSRILTNF